MKIIIIFLLIIKTSFFEIKEAVYKFYYKNRYFKVIHQKIELSGVFNKGNNINIRIKKIKDNITENFYTIENIEDNSVLTLNKDNQLIFVENLKEEQSLKWKFINIKGNKYVLLNYNRCFLKYIHRKIFCKNIELERASFFDLEELYEEVKDNKIDNNIINNEPIDVLIKYIDLKDPFLIRNNIHQIKKDFDNEELKYSIRSILTNIPWIRKIFILMPNKRVRFLKRYELIKEKIIYINDKELLGYHSSNCRAFFYRYWMMKKYGISNNIIIMDDDYFIGKPLNKSNFFYVENNKVVPAIINKHFYEIDKKYISAKYEYYKKIIDDSKEEQTTSIFIYSQILAYLLLLKIFNKTKINIPLFTHNAIPVNLDDLKEIFDIVNQSEFRFDTLESLYRNKNGIQFQSFVLGYIFLKYKRKVKNISFRYIDISKSLINHYNTSLFCLNTGSIKYSSLIFMKENIIMNYLFPNPTIYELDAPKKLMNISFQVVLYMEKELIKTKKDAFRIKIIFIIFSNSIFFALIIFKYNKLICKYINSMSTFNIKYLLKTLILIPLFIVIFYLFIYIQI